MKSLPVGRLADGDGPVQHEVAVVPGGEKQQQGEVGETSEISDKVSSPVTEGQLVTGL